METRNVLEPPPMGRFLWTRLSDEVLGVCLSCYLLTLKSRYLCHQVPRTTCCGTTLRAALTCEITTGPHIRAHTSQPRPYSAVAPKNSASSDNVTLSKFFAWHACNQIQLLSQQNLLGNTKPKGPFINYVNSFRLFFTPPPVTPR